MKNYLDCMWVAPNGVATSLRLFKFEGEYTVYENGIEGVKGQDFGSYEEAKNCFFDRYEYLCSLVGYREKVRVSL